jgi:cytochrome P450
MIIDVNDNIFKILPFGSGRITCLGHPLGALMMEIVLAHLFHY